VPAGIDRFPRAIVERFFSGDNAAPGVPVERVLALGAEDFEGGDPSVFNMAINGLRLAQRANGVSTLHGEVSRSMFGGLWAGFDPDDVPITSITNGVHAPTWLAPDLIAITNEFGGPEALDNADGWNALAHSGDERLWAVKRGMRDRLVHNARRRLRASWLERGASLSELEWVDSALSPDVLTIGFARRVPS
jgi:starch phosphorylase